MKAFIESYGFLIVLLPLAGAAINGLLGRWLQRSIGEKAIGAIASGSVFASFVLSVAAFIVVGRSHGEPIINRFYTWLDVGYLKVDVAFLFDPLSAVMLLVVTGVGFLIHVYSTAYMKGDPSFYRFFAYLNLFVFSMLVLVLGESLLLMFVGWEGVGLCSYLLIGFWFEERVNAIAGNKAFIVNRVGDLGFIVGMFMLFWILQAGAGEGASLLSFQVLKEHIGLLDGAHIFGISAATLIALCLFLGATGKSAQIPLYVWLPDAMAGPTPVSALIHAATMVTAGVYMIGRLNFLFALSPVAMGVVAVVGAATALVAATIGCVQNDIKKVLAYSTVSQLGYMMLAMGVGAYSAGIFHLMTHAFFKACLFLGAGSVILGMHHEQDIRWMGGLRRLMPRTFWTFAIATAAIAGLPPFAGFFSKDEILWAAWHSEHGHPLLWLTGFVTAGITAFYMTRLLILTFFGQNRISHRPADAVPHGGHHGELEVKESPSVITVPLMILAVLSLMGGFVGVPKALGGENQFGHFLESVLGGHTPVHDPMEYVLMAASVAVAVSGIAVAYLLYVRRPEVPGLLAAKARTAYRLVLNKYFLDELYDIVFVKGSILLSKGLALFDKYVIDLAVNLSGLAVRVQSAMAGWFDDNVVDLAVNRVADSTLDMGRGARRIQTGRIQVYLLILLAAIAGGVGIKLLF